MQDNVLPFSISISHAPITFNIPKVFFSASIVFFFFIVPAIPGFKIKIVGCYKENTAKRNIPTILFSDARGTNSKTKIDYKNFGNYIKDAVTRCAKMTNTRSFSFFAMQKIGKCRRLNFWRTHGNGDPFPLPSHFDMTTKMTTTLACILES